MSGPLKKVLKRGGAHKREVGSIDLQGVPKKKFMIEFFEVRQLWALPGNFGHFWMLWTLLDIFGQSGTF